MENFYDKIKKKMGDYPETPTDWNAWEKINNELRPDNKRNVIPLWIWLPISLLATGILGFWLGNSNAIFSPISQNQISDSTVKIDTIYLTNTVTLNDTFYQDRYITQWKYNETKPNANEIISSTTYQTLLASKQDFENQLLEYQRTLANHPIAHHPSFKSLPGLSNYISNNGKDKQLAIEEELLGRIYKIKLTPIHSLNYNLLQLKERLISGLDVNKYPIATLKSKQNLLNIIFPDYINIGASLEGPFLSFTQDGNVGLEFGGGLHTELLFSPRFSMLTGIRARNNSTAINDEAEALLYPQPMEIDPGEAFKGLSLKNSFLDIPIQIKYKYSTKGIDKYITAGLLTTKTSSTEYLYEYSTTGGETYREVKGGSSAWALGSATLGLGFEYDVSNSFNLFVEPYARFNFKNPVDARNQFSGIGLRLGTVYKL